jgi:FtsH-binding integral membrane protein
MLDRLDQKDKLAHVFVLTTGVFAGMAALALFGPLNFLGFGMFLFAGLIGMILAEVVWMILEMSGTVSETTANTGDKVFSWLGVALFALYTAYDTQSIKRRAALCKGQGDYVNESLSLFLDFLNLFTNIASLQED